MTADVCAACGGAVVDIEVAPVQRLAGVHFASAAGVPVAGSLAATCSDCGQFAGERCDLCRGRVLWQWDGPGQALWVCETCGDTDIALQAPMRPHTWTCSKCG